MIEEKEFNNRVNDLCFKMQDIYRDEVMGVSCMALISCLMSVHNHINNIVTLDEIHYLMNEMSTKKTDHKNES
jgi:hypothetical protein